MPSDFTLSVYRSLCNTVLEAGYLTTTLSQYCRSDFQSAVPIVVFRHDVDRSPIDALNMAEMEAGLGIASTYYVRSKPHVFQPSLLTRLGELGHEVGYHYESLADAGGHALRALSLFQKDLERFRKYVPIETISMHGRPFSRWDSRDLWKGHDFREFGLIAEAYLSLDYDRIAYYCDTGRTWNSTKHNLRDHVCGSPHEEIDTTAELIDLVRRKRYRHLCISCHPNRWPRSRSGYALSVVSDWGANLAKMILKEGRRLRHG